MTMVTVRPAQAGDLASIARIFVACWHGSYADLLPPDVRDMYTSESASDLWRRAPLDHMLVAEVPHRGVLGVTRFGPDPDEPTDGHIFSLYVDPDESGTRPGPGTADRRRGPAARHRVRRGDPVGVRGQRASPGLL